MDAALKFGGFRCFGCIFPLSHVSFAGIGISLCAMRVILLSV